MRRLTMDLRKEHGGMALVVGLLVIPLLAVLVLVVDAGILYVERAQLQAGADAAALAVARDCALGSCAPADYLPTAQALADANAADGTADVADVSFPTANSVTVVTRSLNTRGENVVDLAAANLLGIAALPVRASATAAWSAFGTARTLPLTISWCSFLDATGGGLPSDDTEILIQYNKTDGSVDCYGPSGMPVPGGFGWLSTDSSCEVTTSLDDEEFTDGDPGAARPAGCDPTEWQNEVVLLPIFEETNDLGGANAGYKFYAYAAFRITGYRFPGASWNHTSPPSCTGECNGIKGYFLQYVFDPSLGSGSGPNLGAVSVRLTG
jgi:Flp pilus assembly protein TadG